MSASYRFVVTGRVQGVYFRESARQQAAALGIGGWVRNLPDGRVEGIAFGDSETLETLRRWLQIGPAAARVDALDWQADESAAEPASAQFVVRR